MGVHKLTAGDGYTYLTRQVAVADASDRGHQGLADYYAEKGESPGRWVGGGLAALGLSVGDEVTESQMRNLFGEGRHPDAEQLEDAALDAGKGVAAAKKASQLGRVFAIYRGNQPEFLQETARRYVAYNLERGLHWRTAVPAEVRAQIRTELGNELFVREHARAPLDARERGAFMAKASRQQTTAVAGYDLTFTPVKSVSTLWAVAGREVASCIEDAHHGAVEATLAWLEQEALFTRRGRGGIQQVKASGLIAASFTHRDARSSDPHLHTHVAVSNKVQDATGRWLAVDGRVIYKANVTLSEMYNTLLEAELTGRLGVRFEARDRVVANGASKRPVREIVGIDARLAAAWSKRHQAIETRRRDLTAAFQAEHGRPPTDGEAVTLAEKAWDQTRQAKHEPRSEHDQRTAWRADAATILGGEQVIDDMVERCLGHATRAQDITDTWVDQTAQSVVARVAEDRATWQVWHLRAEAERHARAHSIRRSDLAAAVDRVLDAAITGHCLALGDADPLADAASAASIGVDIPVPLQRGDRADGVARRAAAGGGRETVSVYSLSGARQYTSPAIIEAEQRIVDAARRTGGRRISEVRVSIALAEAAANSGPGQVMLNAAQRSLVREMATSGRAVQLALAPAGTGKTTAMQILTRAWQDSGGTVIGLAPSAVAAQELGASVNPDPPDSTDGTDGTAAAGPADVSHVSDTSDAREVPGPDRAPWRPKPSGRSKVRADTLAKLVWHAKNGRAPSWMEAIDYDTLVLIDEAGMAATTDLAAAIDYITSRGGQVRLVGDDRQLASVAAGGVLRDIADQVGAITLGEVHRFRHLDGSLNHAEAAATLALREGDPSAIVFYADRGRIHVGDLGACADQAYAAWAADRAAGTDSVLLAPTRDLVCELNTRARDDRIADQPTSEIERVVRLADGTEASAGDRIITRANDRRLPITPTDWVKNGDRWTVTQVHDDDSLSVVHDQLGKSITLPAPYVASTVQLGYATTVHGAQGITTGTCHVVLTGEEDRNLLYVALSRGRYANHLYLDTASDGDPHNLIRPEALIPPTALDRLTDMLRRDGSPVSAATTRREMHDPHRLLGDLAARYHDAVTTGSEHLIGTTGMTKIDTLADSLHPGLTEAPAWPTLRSHLALLALDEHNPLRLLTDAVAAGSLADARDPAAVLDARIDDLTAHPRADAPRSTSPDRWGVRADMRPDMPTDLPASAGTPAAASRAAGSRATGSTSEGPLPWLPGVPARLARNLDWGPFTGSYHQLVRDQVAAVDTAARAWTGATAPPWAQPFLEPEDTDLRAQLAIWRAVTGADETDLRPTGPRTIGAPGAHQARLNRAVRRARPSYPFAQRTWYRALPESVRQDPWITPLCHRLARLERAGLPVATYITEALGTDPALADASASGHHTTARPGPEDHGPTPARPLPDEQQAAALWWRLVRHLGPAALGADERSADLLQPAWRTALTELVGTSKADYLQHAPAWPALVAAVDDACEHHQWTPDGILAAALAGVRQDGTLTGVEIADALVLRIAMLTDQPPHEPEEPPGSQHDEVLDDTSAGLPADAEEFMAAYYRDHAPEGLPHISDPATPGDHSPALDDPYVPDRVEEPFRDQLAEDPYLPPMLGQQPETGADEVIVPDPAEVPADRIKELNQQALDYFESCYPRSWAPGYLADRLGTDLIDHSHLTAGYAPPGGRSLMRHLTAQGATLAELEQAGLVSLRSRADGTTYYRDFFRDRMVMPIRDPHDPDPHPEHGAAILGFVGRRNPTKTDADYAGPKYLNTRTTSIFTKGEALYGYAEARPALAGGALPIIVEGPMDAMAITVASDATAAGIAPMGTALTVDQIKLLRSHIDLVHGHDQVAVATDADPAGWKSAQTAFWKPRAPCAAP